MATSTPAIGYICPHGKRETSRLPSVADQRQAIRAYCNQHGLELLAIESDDSETANPPLFERPGGKRAL